MKIGCVISILLVRSNLSSWPSLSICEQNETRKHYHLFSSLVVWNPDLSRLDAVAKPSVLSIFWVDFLWVCPNLSGIVSGCNCVIALLLIGNCSEGRILFNALMHGTVNTGLYRIWNLRWGFSIFQHSEWIRWLQGIVKRSVMKVCIGLVWLMIRYGSGFCKREKEASSCAVGETKHSDISELHRCVRISMNIKWEFIHSIF